MKKIISLLMVLTMVLSLISLPAFAASEGTDYITVDDNTIRILTQDGWNAKWESYKNKTIYLECNITVSTTKNYSKGKLIGRLNGVEDASPIITLDNVENGLYANIQDSGATVDKLEFKNLIFKGTVNNNANSFSAGAAGILTGWIKNYGEKDIEIENVVSDVTFTTNQTSFDVGLVGKIYTEKITTDGTTILFKNCVNETDFTSCYTESNSHGTGGIIGRYLNLKQNVRLKIENCSNYGDITAASTAGGILGASSSDGMDALYEITGCKNYGKITTTGTGTNGRSGGIVGYARGKNISIIKSSNYGTIESKSQYAGGIVGASYDTVGVISYDQCFNQGNVTALSKLAAGIDGGDSTAYSTKSITNCYNTGAINGGSGATAGITLQSSKSGAATGNNTIKNNYNAGAITTTSNSNVIKVVGTVFTKSSASTYHTSEVLNNYFLVGVAGNAYINIEKATGTDKLMINEETLRPSTEAGFDRLPTGFDSNVWVALEGGYPVLKNNLPKNTDGTDKVYKTVALASYDSSMGNVLKDTETLVEEGNTYKFTVTTEDGYKVESVMQDETLLEGTDGVYETSAISDDTTITVTFEEIPAGNEVISSSNYYSTNEAEKYNIYAFGKISLAETPTEFGMLLFFDEIDDENFAVETEGVRKYTAESGYYNDGTYGQFGIKFNGNLIEENGTYYLRPYAVYNGVYVYGDIISEKYNSEN